MVAQGGDIIDIGGESTRPGAGMPHRREELARVLPVVRHAITLGVPVSIDTSRPEVIAEVVSAGADIVNDVRALTWPGALACVARTARVGVCLMHMQGTPRTMQQRPHYGDVCAEVHAYLATRAIATRSAGIDGERIVLDPGYGFGKTPEHNWALLRAQPRLLELGYPVLAGLSRKSVLGFLTGRSAADRLAASVSAALAAAVQGARVLRVHDVGATVDALKVWRAAGLDS